MSDTAGGDGWRSRSMAARATNVAASSAQAGHGQVRSDHGTPTSGEQGAGERLDEGVARRDGGCARPAPAPEHQPRDDRDVVGGRAPASRSVGQNEPG